MFYSLAQKQFLESFPFHKNNTWFRCYVLYFQIINMPSISPLERFVL